MRTSKQEVKKQLVDQPLHFLWALVAALPLALTRRRGRWFWIALVWLLGNTSFIVTREVLQWPSSRPWDPWLDWTFFVLGAVSAVAVWWWQRR